MSMPHVTREMCSRLIVKFELGFDFLTEIIRAFLLIVVNSRSTGRWHITTQIQQWKIVLNALTKTWLNVASHDAFVQNLCLLFSRWTKN